MFKRIKRWFSRPKNPAGHVYYARLNTPQGIFYKLGFTSKPSLVERMAYSGDGDEKMIDHQFFFTHRNDAWDVEQTLLEHFNKRRAFGKYSRDPSKPLCGRGQSELFSHDILGLDDDLYPSSEEALKALQIESEQGNGGWMLILIGLVLLPFTWGISLLLILMGGYGLIEFTQSHQMRTAQVTRPVHSPIIQELIDTLNLRKNIIPSTLVNRG